MPKKTKQYGWQCSECDIDKEGTSVEESNISVVKGPRASQLRVNPRFSLGTCFVKAMDKLALGYWVQIVIT